MKTDLTVRHLKPDEYSLWDAFVASSPDGSLYATSGYLDVFCRVTSAKFKILAALKNDEIFGGVAVYERNFFLGTFVSPRLLLYYNGLIMKDFTGKYPSKQTSRRNEVMSALENHLSQKKYARLFLHNRSTVRDVRVFQKQGWGVNIGYTYVVPLKDLSSLWNRTEQNLRRLINRCSQQDVRFSADDDFDSFYRMHLNTRHRKGISLYLPRESFKQYFERLSSLGLCRLYFARLPGGRPVSTQLVLLGKHPVSHTVCAAGDPEYLKWGVNPFLRWKVFEDLSKQGYEANDLTDATLNSVSRFKSQLGADLELCLNIRKKDSAVFRIRENSRIILSRQKNKLAKLRCKSILNHS